MGKAEAQGQDHGGPVGDDRPARSPSPAPEARPDANAGAIPGPGGMVSESERIDRELAKEALRLKAQGKMPSARHAAALRRVERKREEALRWDYYRSIPKKHWREMSGRQDKVLNEQATRYGLPVGGPTIDLLEVVSWLHGFFAQHRSELAAMVDADQASLTLRDQLDQIKVERARMQLDKEQGQLVEREAVRMGLNKLSALLRNAGETLRDQCSEEAHLVLQEALDEFKNLVESGEVGI